MIFLKPILLTFTVLGFSIWFVPMIECVSLENQRNLCVDLIGLFTPIENNNDEHTNDEDNNDEPQKYTNDEAHYDVYFHPNKIVDKDPKHQQFDYTIHNNDEHNNDERKTLNLFRNGDKIKCFDSIMKSLDIDKMYFTGGKSGTTGTSRKSGKSGMRTVRTGKIAAEMSIRPSGNIDTHVDVGKRVNIIMKLREEYTKYYTRHYNANSSTGVDVDLTDPIKAFCNDFIPDNKKEYLYDFIKGLIASTS